MAENPSTKVAIPALAKTAYTAKQAKRRKTVSLKREAKRESDNKRNKTRINIGEAFQRWRDLRDCIGLKLDSELAILLLDSYEKIRDMSTPQKVRQVARLPDSAASCISAGSLSDRDDEFSVTLDEDLDSNSNEDSALDASNDWPEDTLSPTEEAESDSSLEEDWEVDSEDSADDCTTPLCVRTRGALRSSVSLDVLPHVSAEDTVRDASDVGPTGTDAPEALEMPEKLEALNENEVIGQSASIANHMNFKLLAEMLPIPICTPKDPVTSAECQAPGPRQDQLKEEDDMHEWLAEDKETAEAPGAVETGSAPISSDTLLLERKSAEIVRGPEPEHSSSHEQSQKKPSEGPKQCQGPRRLKKTYDCPTCRKGFSHNADLKRHLVIHSGKRPYKCFICGRGFTQSGNLKTHMKVHKEELPVWTLVKEKSPPKESPVTVNVCGECGMDFPQKQQLEEHRQSHKKPYACPVCGKTFKHENYLKIHHRIHSGDSPFLCSECGKSCVTAGALKQHEWTHTGEKNYHCDQCGKAFSQSSHLKVHLKTHTGERPHLCSICGKSYSKACGLKVHLRVHTGEKPYNCEKCGKCFYYLQNYQKHLKIHNKKPKPPTKPLGRPKQQLLDANDQ
ncbi:zinc finger protein 35-like isoform X2 [Centropristis striata]|uniref:zinc finger protein 35-like isoform X2 n=1 Tax=Centropristis striata TaxID=184440 RepID=UPI0027E02552|nr:zinc finger protein 35-like isoform X2 [Centropristis striata]